MLHRACWDPFINEEFMTCCDDGLVYYIGFVLISH